MEKINYEDIYQTSTKQDYHVSLYLVTKSCPTLMTSWTIACQAPLSMGFSRQEYWSGLPSPSPGNRIFPTQRLNLSLLHLLHWQMDSLLLSHHKPGFICYPGLLDDSYGPYQPNTHYSIILREM